MKPTTWKHKSMEQLIQPKKKLLSNSNQAEHQKCNSA